MIRDYKVTDDLERILSESHKQPVFLIKHSTRCPGSTAALNEFISFAESDGKSRFWKILVVEDRDLSLHQADQCAVIHESPQVILFNKGQVVDSISHGAITEIELKRMLSVVID